MTNALLNPGKPPGDLTRSEEEQVRQHPTCSGCGGPKDSGRARCLLCWDCFKYRDDNAFKYWEEGRPLAGNLRVWLLAIGRPSLEEQGILDASGDPARQGGGA